MPLPLKAAALTATLACAFLTAAHATIAPAPLFTDNAVLQRGQSIPVWGTAEPEENITVSLNGKTAQTAANGAGEWMVKLPEQTAGGPYTLTISGNKSETVALKNILIGEVWLCSGQSNMEYPLSGMSPDAITKATIPTVNDPQLRFVMVARTLAPTPQKKVGAQWKEATPDTVAPLSAVAYYFARDLRRSLNVPVGIVESAFGGTFGQCWMSREAIESQPSLKYYLDEEAAYATITYPKLLQDYQAALPEYQKKLDAEKIAYDAAVQAGGPRPRRPSLPKPPQTPAQWQAAPTHLFNGMIAPLIPYAIRGAVWYQGEGNWNKGYEYHTLLPTLITDWRSRWKQGDFPFYIVQLPPNQAVNPNPERSWLAEVREAQRLAALRLPNTELVVTTDVGDSKDIHPYRKEPVGQRLAILARAGVYGEKIESSGPVLDAVVPEGNQIRVRFTHAQGLRTAQITDRLDNGPMVAPADQVTGFTIAGADNRFFNATAKIEGTSVVLSAPDVAAPVAVRYGWSQFPLANLQNGAGLWASPFRTDNDRLISQNVKPAVQPVNNAAPIQLKPRKAPPYIVLKLDDLGHMGNGGVPPRWIKVIDFIRQRDLHASIGIICNSLEGDNPKYTGWIKAQQATGLFEFWNHGYTHKEWDENGQHMWEFKGPSYEEQKQHFVRSEELAREKLGISLSTFGPGFNQTDDNTLKAISEVGTIKIWLYGDPRNAGGKIILERPPWIGIENPTFVPSLDKFIRPYNNQADREFFVIQGHPNMWDDARFAEFVRIIDFLTEQKAVFVTPTELVQIKNLKP